MIEWKLTPEDVARIRFAISPVLELVLSLVVLRAPARHSLHLPWIRWARSQLDDLKLEELLALIPVEGITADSLTPPPTTPRPDIAEELDIIRQTSPDRVVGDLADIPGLPDHIARQVSADPAGATARLAETMDVYWSRVLARHWPAIRATLEADVLWRSRELSIGGMRSVFADLHENVIWRGDKVVATDPWSYSGNLTGEGIVLVPSAMAWPSIRKMVAPHQPMIVYPARGLAELWDATPAPPPDTLTALLGRTRASLLAGLAEPSTTTVLARRLAVSPGAVSQHLSVLLASGLVSRTRLAGSVLYVRTPTGDRLADSGSGGQTRGTH